MTRATFKPTDTPEMKALEESFAAERAKVLRRTRLERRLYALEDRREKLVKSYEPRLDALEHEIDDIRDELLELEDRVIVTNEEILAALVAENPEPIVAQLSGQDV